MEGKLDLDSEVERLLGYRGRLEGVVVNTLTHDEKINILAQGVIDGWYNVEIVQRAMLRDRYGEVVDWIEQHYK